MCSLHGAYLSVAEALRHAGYETGARVEIKWIDSETVTPENAPDILGGCDGIIIPSGFGNRGIEGKLRRHSSPVKKCSLFRALLRYADCSD